VVFAVDALQNKNYDLSMSRKTQSFFSNSEYQSKMLQIFAGITLFQGGVFALLGFGLLENVKSVAEKAGIKEGHPFYESLRMEETFVYVAILSGIAIASMVFVWLGLKYSHDAVGAIYRMKKDIEIMTEKKELGLLKLRRNDYFKDFENSFNELIKTVKPDAQVANSKKFQEQPAENADNVEELRKKQA
jgi:hypothetical protein